MCLLAQLAARGLFPRHLPPPAWPAGTLHLADDVEVEGESLARLAAARGTPCVRIAPAAPGSAEAYTTVIVTRVLGCSATAVRCDTVLAGLPVAADARVLGRAASGSMRAREIAGTTVTALLPDDLHAGDLLALPCPGVIPRSRVRRRGRQDEPAAHCLR